MTEECNFLGGICCNRVQKVYPSVLSKGQVFLPSLPLARGREGDDSRCPRAAGVLVHTLLYTQARGLGSNHVHTVVVRCETLILLSNQKI